MDKSAHIFILSLFAFASCAGPKDMYNEWRPKLEKGERLQSVNQFWNSDTIGSYDGLWQNLHHLKNIDRERQKDTLAGSWVQIELLGDSTIEAKLFHQDALIDSLSIQGRIEKEHYFVTDQSHKYKVIPLIYFKNLNSQYIMYLDESEDLVVRGLHFNRGAILFIIGGGAFTSRSTYQKRD